ncbi:MAG: permease [Endomicrobia bacterium]|nr:permease [Endomicrobiia bacterium]
MMKELLNSGFLSLKDYVATHILTCLVPAFLLAGAMVSFINKQTVLLYFGEKTNKLKTFFLSSISSFFLAACSCTVIPVACGLYYSGAGVGAAFIVLWVAPSTNILSLLYTGNILGINMVLARVSASLVMAFIVGTVMMTFFSKEKLNTYYTETNQEVRNPIIGENELILLVLIFTSLIMPNYLVQKGKYLYKILVWLFFTAVVFIYSLKFLDKRKIKSWLTETLFFVKAIFPLLLIGVFIVGIISKIVPQQLIQKYLGGNSIKASFFATLLGSISYFATMTEAPFVDTLMKLGMGKGPALALLLTGPGLSLPNWLAIARIFGIKKAIVYVLTIIILGTIVGWIFGNFIF